MNNFLKVAMFGLLALCLSTPVSAATVRFYSAAGDGTIRRAYDSDWSTVRNHSTANFNYGTEENTSARSFKDGTSNDRFGVERVFLPFDTSSLPDDAIITSATLNLFSAFKQSSTTLALIQTAQAAISELADTDYDALTLNVPSEGATRKNTDDWSLSSYSPWSLNATGRGFISKTGPTFLGVREAHDVDDIEPGNVEYHGIQFNFSEVAGTSTDPYLEVSYSVLVPPSSLLTEGTSTASRVVDLTPEFSSIFNGGEEGDTSNAYQVQVSTSASNWTSALVWDSEKQSLATTTSGNRIPDIEYAGTPLVWDGSTYYWRIRLWDQSDAASPWSSNAQYTMALATTTRIYSSAGDGTIRHAYDTDWSTVRNHSTANSNYGTEEYTYARSFKDGTTGDRFGVERVFLPFDTSSLPDAGTIVGASLNLHATYKQSTTSLVLIQTTQASASVLDDEDYNNLILSNPTEGAVRKNTGDWNIGSYSHWDLDNVGLGFVSKTGTTYLGIREAHDVDNIEPGNVEYHGIMFNFSEASGIMADPYLEVIYLLP